MKKTPQKAKKIKKILDIRELSFEVADKKILDAINLEVLAGERWVMLGANGSGKTSLISTICAYNTPSSGAMTVDGKTYSEYDWQKVREKIALVGSQLQRQIDNDEHVVDVVVSGKYAQINYWGEMTVKLVKEAYARMKRMGVGHLIDSSWAYISQGERQKILIARALMIKPSLVFLDEPCTGLDPIARRSFIEFLDELAKDRKIPAVIMATHYVEEIPPSFTHAMIIKDGKIMAAGKKEDVLTSKTLSDAYGAKCTLKKSGRYYELKVK